MGAVSAMSYHFDMSILHVTRREAGDAPVHAVGMN